MFQKVVVALGSATTKGLSDQHTLVMTLPSLQNMDSQHHRSSLSKESLGSLELYLLASELSSVYNNPLELANWIPFLRPNAQVKIIVSSDSNEKTLPSSLKLIHTSLLLAGLKATSEEHLSNEDIILHVQRKERTSTQSRPLPKLNTAVEVNLDDTDDLIDEDDLLTGGDVANDAFLKPPNMDAPKTNNTDDCAGRLPCDNCSCGRADGKVIPAEELTKEELLQKSSACGNCPKGDAFRCASCPFLGKPAFKTGEEHLVLNLVDDL
mmetsp:Transcript_7194/g.10508  ORF Transcript_7194/g.10508 Transcript_7194/m.10508 type:complete len:266 (+) Transcript_7194:134-931(+)|eukprot:CAMPEP_0194212766 /NCGR_PEP_ID=MMETSP0156-20130528/12823_1 /TAXON_ID=33649 /ORGANISM="Thalassionema nitzschioides, Strain L26-B" /LENGTH=265 /DNA_ID=CAMNT_0038940645 /DNA_START=86 /DNA_END=883 /DNA_ORIENTATION=-